MKSLYAAVVMTVCLAGQPASACFFPYMPMPFAGYSPWGAGYGLANYGYGNAGYASYGYRGGCQTGCQTGCGVYSAGYQSYSAPTFLSNAVSYGNAGCGSCGNTCGGTCGSTFSQSLNYGGGCSNCGSDCIGTESRKVPEPDADYNKDRPTREYGADDDRRNDRLRDDTRREDGFRDNSRREDGFGREDDLGREDGFGAPAGTRSGPGYETEAERRMRLDRERSDSLGGGTGADSGRGWNPADTAPADRSRFDRPSTGGGIDDRSPLRDPNPIGGSEMPEPFEGFGGGNKPPMPEPSEIEPAAETSVRKPAMPEIGDGVDVEDFLPPEPAADARTSHADVLTMPRLAGRARVRTTSRSKLSSGQKKQTPARWISLPMPTGRARS